MEAGETMSLKSPLRYPGGKRKLFKYTKELILKNTLQHCTYIEPFAGGAGLALELLDKGIVDTIILNDVDRSIYAIWYSILNHTEAFCNLITSTEVTMERWYIEKERQLEKNELDLLTLGFSTFFLNRTNRSGIINGGVIGGKEQTGTYKLDCRFNKEGLIKRIQEIASKKDNILLYNLDAIEFINNVLINYQENAFIFLDPPYYKKGPELYQNHYLHQDHIELCNEITHNIHCPWIVTYDNNDVIKEMYSHFTQQEFSLTYSAQNKCKGKEVMIYSNNIIPLEME